MPEDLILMKLQAERDLKPRMGLCSIFNFLNKVIFNSAPETKQFMIQNLGYKKWMVNKSQYLINYHQMYYQQRKVNSARIDKRN